MEQERFDHLVKTLAKPMPRRKMLLAMAGAVGAAMFGLRPRRALAITCPSCQAPCFDPATGASVCCATGQVCDTYSGCVSVCGPEAPKFCGCVGVGIACCAATQCCCSNVDGEFCCPSGTVCSGSTCTACPAGQTNCNCACVNTSSDVNNCGACGNVCAPGQNCCDGECCGNVCCDLVCCLPTQTCCPQGEFAVCCCPTGQFLCGGRCIPQCTPLDQCHVAGVCDPYTGRCTNPEAPNGTPCTGTDRCFQTYTCQAGVCMGSNPVVCTPSDQCHLAGSCDPSTGTCSNPPAPDGTTCVGTNPCFQTNTCQSGICTGSNPVQCAECTVCDPYSGVCAPVSNGTACSSGTCCAGICVNLTTNPSNCGRCGNVCSEGLTCCSGTCVNLQTSSNNCGGCGIVCPTTCSQGRCTFTRTVTVPARGGWVDTGINVYTIDSMTSTARGYWSPGPPSVTVSADGYSQPWPDNFLNRLDIGNCPPPHKVAHWAALVGYIGSSPPGLGSYCTQPSVALTESQKVFLVGSYFHGSPPRAGRLYLAINDDAYSGFNSDNAGQMQVTITIMR